MSLNLEAILTDARTSLLNFSDSIKNRNFEGDVYISSCLQIIEQKLSKLKAPLEETQALKGRVQVLEESLKTTQEELQKTQDELALEKNNSALWQHQFNLSQKNYFAAQEIIRLQGTLSRQREVVTPQMMRETTDPAQLLRFTDQIVEERLAPARKRQRRESVALTPSNFQHFIPISQPPSPFPTEETTPSARSTAQQTPQEFADSVLIP